MKSTTYMEFYSPPSLSGPMGVPNDRDTTVAVTSKKTLPPPTSGNVPLRVHLERLKRTSERGFHTKPLRHTERLREQVKTWSESMTPEQLTRRFSTDEIERLAGLIGKHGGRAAHHHMAQALRAVGFTPCRDWTVAGRNRRYWIWSVK
jgi:hypothetical protein